MHYLLFYEFVPDYAARRAPFRTAHLLAAWKAQARGELILAGAYADPVDGAALCFDAIQGRYRSASLRLIPM